MSLREHDVVAVTVDVPDQGVAAGDVGAVVHCYPSGETYEVDFVDDHGRGKGVVTLSGAQFLRLNLVSLLAS